MADGTDLVSLCQRVRRLEDEIKLLKDEEKEALAKIEQMLIDQAVQGAQYANILQEIKSLRSDITNIRDRPAKRWDVVVTALITGVISIALAMLLKGGA